MNVSCVIPAYNEASSIAHTLRAAVDSNIFFEILVVDDGSGDGTPDIVRGFPSVILLVNERNLGKAGAVARGIREARGEYVLLLDADLRGLKAEHIRALGEPVLKGEADVTISIRENTPQWMKAVGVDFMSGERVLPRALVLPYLETMASLRSYGLEVYTNRWLIEGKVRLRSVYWRGVTNTMKWQRRSFLSGIRHEAGLWRDIFSYISPWEFVTQNMALRKLLV